MSAARKPASRPRRLVLVRGGLDARNDGGDADWEDFCRRIGWQEPAEGPDADFERRIAEGLFTKPIAPENVIDLDLEREARHVDADEFERSFVHELRRSFVREIHGSPAEEPPVSGERAREAFGADPRDIEPPAPSIDAARLPDAAEADLAPEVGADRLRRGWVRVGVAALTLALAAAVTLAVTRLAFSSAASRTATIAAPSGETVRGSEPDPRGDRDAPRIDAPLLPSKLGPVRPAPPEGPTAKPAPSPKPVHDAKPEPPGALVARRDVSPGPRADEPTKDDVPPADAPKAESEAPLAVASLDAAGTAGAWPGAGIHADPAASWSASRNAGSTAVGGLLHNRVALSAVDDGGSVPVRTGADVWSKAPSAADPERTSSNASWSLSGARDRWVGASLTPSPSTFAPASVGVMVELDLGRALSKL